MKKLGLYLLGVVFLTLVYSVEAGGGLNAIIHSERTVGFTGNEGIKISAVVYNSSLPAPHDQGFVAGKEFVFEIEDIDTTKGQLCQTTKPTSDNQGKVEGICFAKKAGFLKVYLREADSIQRTASFTLKYVYPLSENPSLISVTAGNAKDEKETDKRIESLESKVETLSENLDSQKKEMNALQRLLEEIVSFLKQIRFGNL